MKHPLYKKDLEEIKQALAYVTEKCGELSDSLKKNKKDLDSIKTELKIVEVETIKEVLNER